MEITRNCQKDKKNNLDTKEVTILWFVTVRTTELTAVFPSSIISPDIASIDLDLLSFPLEDTSRELGPVTTVLDLIFAKSSPPDCDRLIELLSGDGGKFSIT
jgi:hypothetical protein